MKIYKRVLLGIISAAMAVSLTACSMGSYHVMWTQNLNTSSLFQIGEEKCDIGFAKVFLLSYYKEYGETLDPSVWNDDKGNGSLEDYVKEVTLSSLARMVTMDQLAKESMVELTESEKADADKAAAQYEKSLSKEEASYIGLSSSKLEELFEQYALATKLYVNLTGGIDEEISDDDARVMIVQRIVVDTEEDAGKVTERLEAGDDFEQVAGYYSKVSVAEYRLYKQDMTAIEVAALSALDDGDISSLIEEGNRYYYYRVVSKIDRELTEANKETILKNRAEVSFGDVYEEFKAELNSTFNYTLWNETSLREFTGSSEGDFFKVFKEYCSYLNTK